MGLLDNTLPHVPYRLKISRLKIFTDFAGQSKATKIFSCEFFSASLMLGVAGSSTAKNLSMKILAKTQNIYPSKILGYNIMVSVRQMSNLQ